MAERKKSPLKPDPGEVAAYPLSEASRYLRLPSATLRSWVLGRAYPRRAGSGYFRPLIKPPDRQRSELSFFNLIEAHVLRALRTEHGVSIKAVRSAIAYSESELGITRLLLRPELCAHGGELLLDKYGELINLSQSGQLAMRKLLEAHLARVAWNAADLPARLFPIVRGLGPDEPRIVAIDPSVSFGRPIVVRRGISTAIISERLDAGEQVADIAEDYRLSRVEVEEAVIFERAA